MKTKREALAKEYIYEALFILMKKKDYRDITITDICEKAGVTRMSFYRNYKTKEDILREFVKTEVLSHFRGSDFNFDNYCSRENFVKLFNVMAENKEICVAFYKAGLIRVVHEQLNQDFLSMHNEGYDPYRFLFFTGGVLNIFLAWLANGEKETPEELADRLGEYFR